MAPLPVSIQLYTLREQAQRDFVDVLRPLRKHVFGLPEARAEVGG